MKILTVADDEEAKLYDYFDKERFPGVELILSCGDLKADYLQFLVSMFNVPLYYVRGNHDHHFQRRPPEGCIDLDGKVLTHRGVRVAGLEGCRGAGGGGVKYTEWEMSKKVAALRYRIWRAGGVDIIITHTSPRHVHDAEDSLHQGFECFHRLIRRCRPPYFIHGHMHLNYRLDARRASLLDDTQVVNAYGPYLFEINTPPGC